jgi:hypothetical protein
MDLVFSVFSRHIQIVPFLETKAINEIIEQKFPVQWPAVCPRLGAESPAIGDTALDGSRDEG